MKRHSFVHNIKHAVCVSIAVCMAVYLSTISAAASTTSGSKWGSPTQKISASAISGTFETAMGNAVFEINQQTDVNFSWTDSTSPSWKSYAADYGATGWEGQSQWNVVLGSTRSASSKLNTRYLSTGMPFDRLKVVWLHELCHVWGLGHVSGINHVMYQSASDAYLRGGVRTLTSDEKNGINNLY